MRIRSIKPSFWSDSHISDLAEPTRLFYVGLWMIADDAGWLRWDTREVARDLYGYETVRRRELRVERMLEELAVAGRVVRYPCGHVEVPTLSNHQRLAGATKQVRTIFNDHFRFCLATVSRPDPQLPALSRTFPQSPATERIGTGTREGTGKERLGTVNASASASEEPTEFQRRVDREEALGSAR